MTTNTERCITLVPLPPGPIDALAVDLASYHGCTLKLGQDPSLIPVVNDMRGSNRHEVIEWAERQERVGVVLVSYDAYEEIWTTLRKQARYVLVSQAVA